MSEREIGQKIAAELQEMNPTMSGHKIIDGLKDAIAGNFSASTIEGQRWVRADHAQGATHPVAWRYRSFGEPIWEYEDKALAADDLFREEEGFEEQPLYAAESQAKEPEASGGLCAEASHAVQVGEPARTGKLSIPALGHASNVSELGVTAGETALLPCPFCGLGQSMVDPWFDDLSKRWAVGCGRCGASSGRSVHAEGSKAAAIKSWNTRGLGAVSEGEPATGSEDPVKTICDVLCKSRVFETGQGTCALTCMDQLGAPRKRGCHHAQRVHDKIAHSILEALAKRAGIKPPSPRSLSSTERA